MADTRYKHPEEYAPYYADFANKLVDLSGESLDSVVSVTASPSGLTIANSQVNGSKIEFTIAGGSDNVEYVITVVGKTSPGEYELTVVGLLDVDNKV